jgi:hypothetical protein
MHNAMNFTAFSTGKPKQLLYPAKTKYSAKYSG